MLCIFFIVISHWVLFIATTVTGPGQLCAEGPADVFGTEGHICVSAREKKLFFHKNIILCTKTCCTQKKIL